jgi:hypothetical protein
LDYKKETNSKPENVHSRPKHRWVPIALNDWSKYLQIDVIFPFKKQIRTDYANESKNKPSLSLSLSLHSCWNQLIFLCSGNISAEISEILVATCAGNNRSNMLTSA